MLHEKSRKIFFTILLFSLSAIILSSCSNFYSNQKSSAFAQTYDPSTDPGAGPIPEDNSTYIASGPIPEDNSTSFTTPDMTSPENQTNTILQSDINATGGSTTSQGTIPEFGSLTGMIVTISVIGVIVATKKLL